MYLIITFVYFLNFSLQEVFSANLTIEDVCVVGPSSVTDFPKGPFTKSQLQSGAVCFNIILAIYFFICLAFICEKYFLPTIERICEILGISQDVAGETNIPYIEINFSMGTYYILATTFMATATTMPEFFTNTVSTFVAESDMGLSAIVGSALFNTLGVAACASFFVKTTIQIDWWPITRDSILFCTIIFVLVGITWDNVVMWWEACILVTLYVLYWILMFQNKRIMDFFKKIIENELKWCQRIKNYDIENQRPKSEVPKDNTEENSKDEIPKSDNDDIWKFPRNTSTLFVIWFFTTWPIRFLLFCTIPDPKKFKNLFPISFVMCIISIGSVSYLIFWMIVVVGDTFDIPESIMGLTFLAFGGCMPEAISAVIVARKGSGEMGVSNALGANCLAVLFSLGIPWFIRTMVDGAGWTNAQIVIFSYGMEYTILILVLAVLTLYTILAFHGFKIRVKVGMYLGISYILFILYSVLMEYNVFLVGEPADC